MAGESTISQYFPASAHSTAHFWKGVSHFAITELAVVRMKGKKAVPISKIEAEKWNKLKVERY